MPKELVPKLQLLAAIQRHTEAKIAESWEGGGDPADIPAIKLEVYQAEEHLRKLIDLIYKEK